MVVVQRLDVANDCCKIGNKLPQPLLPAKAPDEAVSTQLIICAVGKYKDRLKHLKMIPLHYVDDENWIIP